MTAYSRSLPPPTRSMVTLPPPPSSPITRSPTERVKINQRATEQDMAHSPTAATTKERKNGIADKQTDVDCEAEDDGGE